MQAPNRALIDTQKLPGQTTSASTSAAGGLDLCSLVGLQPNSGQEMI